LAAGGERLERDGDNEGPDRSVTSGSGKSEEMVVMNRKPYRPNGSSRSRRLNGRQITHVKGTSKQQSAELARAVVAGKISVEHLTLRQAGGLFGVAPSSCLVRP
jgi:hypothetical protein